MKDCFSDRKRTEELYHDEAHREGIIQRGHLYAGDSSYYKFFYNLIGNVGGLKILEVGCGEGWLAIKLAQGGATVYGIDISGEVVNSATEGAAKEGWSANTTFTKMAVEDLSFDAVQFDLVIGSAILHHTDIKLAMTNIHRVLKQKGRAVFVEPLNENLALKIWRKLTPWRRSPTEQALLKADLDFIRLVFPLAEFHFFGLTSMVTMGLLMFSPKNAGLRSMDRILESVDALILRVFPFLGRFCAVAVLELKKVEQKIGK